MTTNTDAQAGSGAASKAAGTQVTKPKLERTIRVGGVLFDSLPVMKMTFSPDSRYLGIVAWSSAATNEIVVWDMEHDRQQSRIHCDRDVTTSDFDNLLWRADGKAIFFGNKWQWDPMTGKALPDLPAIGEAARLNRDGSKLLTLDGQTNEPSTIYVYDTKTWAVKKMYADGFAARAASWTADDRILVSATPTSAIEGKTLDGHRVEWYDSALRLMDPSGKERTRAVWFPQEPTQDPSSPYTYSFPFGMGAQTSFATNQIFFTSGEIVDGATLSVRHYHSPVPAGMAPGAFGMGLSPDGKALYLKGATFAEPGYKSVENSIVDTASGNQVLQFDGAVGGSGTLAMSPDGRTLALSESSSIRVYKLR